MGQEEQSCYVYIQLPGTTQTVPCASLRVRSIAAGSYEGTFTYGRRYLERADVVAVDPFHLPLSTRAQRFTRLKPESVTLPRKARTHRVSADVRRAGY